MASDLIVDKIHSVLFRGRDAGRSDAAIRDELVELFHEHATDLAYPPKKHSDFRPSCETMHGLSSDTERALIEWIWSVEAERDAQIEALATSPVGEGIVWLDGEWWRVTSYQGTGDKQQADIERGGLEEQRDV